MATIPQGKQTGPHDRLPCWPRVWRPMGPSLLAVLLAASGPAWPQAHVIKEGDFTLRASTVSSETLPESTAHANGIERDPRRGVLNVSIHHRNESQDRNVRGDVQATARNLSGQKRDIPMKEIDANGYVSYLGTYDFVRGEVIDFLIDARPQGSEQKLSLTFRDRMWLTK